MRVCWGVNQAGRRFRVILADARPQLEGQRMLKRLIKRGIPTTYALLNALSCLISVISCSISNILIVISALWVLGSWVHGLFR